MGKVSSLVALLFAHSDIVTRNPSPPTPRGWPLSWLKDSITFPQEKLNKLRGVDATLYVRFLRGCCESLRTLELYPLILVVISILCPCAHIHNYSHSPSDTRSFFFGLGFATVND
jgi:hypothetical protein